MTKFKKLLIAVLIGIMLCGTAIPSKAGIEETKIVYNALKDKYKIKKLNKDKIQNVKSNKDIVNHIFETMGKFGKAYKKTHFYKNSLKNIEEYSISYLSMLGDPMGIIPDEAYSESVKNFKNFINFNNNLPALIIEWVIANKKYINSDKYYHARIAEINYVCNMGLLCWDELTDDERKIVLVLNYMHRIINRDEHNKTVKQVLNNKNDAMIDCSLSSLYSYMHILSGTESIYAHHYKKDYDKYLKISKSFDEFNKICGDITYDLADEIATIERNVLDKSNMTDDDVIRLFQEGVKENKTYIEKLMKIVK